jgi:hypothetical protein
MAPLWRHPIADADADINFKHDPAQMGIAATRQNRSDDPNLGAARHLDDMMYLRKYERAAGVVRTSQSASLGV